MIFKDGAYGEIQCGKFVPLYTIEEYEFRQDAMKQIDSGTMSQNEIIVLQQECVKRRQLSVYSWARKI